MSEVYILVMTLLLGGGGTITTYQEFTSLQQCELAREIAVSSVKGDGSGVIASCRPKG